DRTVRVWDAAGGAELACLRIEDPGVWSRCWSSDGGSWEVHAVGAVAFAAAGRHVLTPSQGARGRRWGPAARARRRTPEGVADFQAAAAGSQWQAFLRGDVLEVESVETGAVVARAPCPRSLSPTRAPVGRPDSRAWAWAVGRHLYFWALRDREEPPG